MAEKKVKLVWVKGAGNDGKVVLNERHPNHPLTAPGRHHEAFIANDGYAYQVAETANVKRLLGEGLLVEADESESYEAQRLADEDELEAQTRSPKGYGGRKAKNAPALRKATDQEESNAKPPVTGFPDEDTSRVPVN